MNEKITYGSDASRIQGSPDKVFTPRTIEELRNIVLSNSRIVARGSGTGLRGGSVGQDGDAVVDTSKLDKIEDFDGNRKLVVVQAGTILSELQSFLKQHNLEFAIDMENRDIVTIGEMVAMNSFGSRALKHKKMENWISWIEVVNSAGNVSRKGATELTDYIGLEGITGVIVRICLKLIDKTDRSVSVLRLENLDSVGEVVRRLKINEKVLGVDFFDKLSSKILGFEEGYYLIVEYEGDSGKLKGEDYEKIMARKDGAIYSLFKEGYYNLEDFKILNSRLGKLGEWLEKRGIPYFGNLGMGVIHPVLNEEQLEVLGETRRFVKSLGGHLYPRFGIGITKKEFVDSVDKRIIENIKKRIDPLNKFNVGKVIDG